MPITNVKYVLEAQERVNDALDVLSRMEVGDPRFERALVEFEDAQVARKSVETKYFAVKERAV